MAINQYLCDTAEYDMDALENAEENDLPESMQSLMIPLHRMAFC